MKKKEFKKRTYVAPTIEVYRLGFENHILESSFTGGHHDAEGGFDLGDGGEAGYNDGIWGGEMEM